MCFSWFFCLYLSDMVKIGDLSRGLQILYASLNLQEALLKSNEVFETFKQEIEKVHKLSFCNSSFLVLHSSL